MKKIIATVGTSIFTNYQRKEVREKYRKDYISIDSEFDKIEHEPASKYSDLCYYYDHLKKTIEDQWFADYKTQEPNKNASAEIKSILAIAKELPEKVEVYLLATDTVVSVLACILVKDWFKEKSQFIFKVVTDEKTIVDLTEENKDALVVTGLRVTDDSSATSNETAVNSGFINLIDKIYNILKANNWEKNKKCDEFILNISGGYKAFIPILTIMGQLNEIPLNYIYEGSETLIEIAHFPLQFDWDLAEQYYPHLENRVLKDAEYIGDNRDVVDQLERDLLVVCNEGKYQVTALGELLKRYVDLNMPHAKQVTGFIAEYKMFEYFHKYPYQGIYSQVERSLKVKNCQVNNNQEEEIDLELRSQKGEVVVCEVKSFHKINVKAIRERAEARIDIYRKNNESIKGYILVIHKGKFGRIGSMSKNLERIKREISQSKVDCQIFYIERPDNYQTFASKPLEENDLKEFTLA